MMITTDHTDQEHLLNRLQMLSERLERLSADSTWARRASGVRGGILKAVEILEQAGEAGAPLDGARLRQLAELADVGYRILEKAATELIE